MEQVHEAKRLREVEAPNAILKQLLAEAYLGVEVLMVAFGVTPDMVDRQALFVPAAPNEIWSIHFVMDALANSRQSARITTRAD